MKIKQILIYLQKSKEIYIYIKKKQQQFKQQW